MKLILSLLFSPFCIAHSAISAQSNILWFVVDDMSAHFSCYGEKLIQTPAVDKIAPPPRLTSRSSAGRTLRKCH